MARGGQCGVTCRGFRGWGDRKSIGGASIREQLRREPLPFGDALDLQGDDDLAWIAHEYGLLKG